MSSSTDRGRPFVPGSDMPTDDKNTNEPYLEFFQHLIVTPNKALPSVISNSYGEDEQVSLALSSQQRWLPLLTSNHRLFLSSTPTASVTSSE